MWAEKQYEYHQKLVVPGGGTGSYTFLRGAVHCNNPELITAIPATWDSGGSSGELRVKEGILPPGDYMRCLLALMEDDNQVQEAITILRDRSDGHPLVNLLASKAEKVHHSVEAGIDGLRRLFKVRGKIVLVSLTDLQLMAKSKKGMEFKDEHEIDGKKKDPGFRERDEISRIYFDRPAKANPRALEALAEADKIVIPSGSPYTSIFPHLLVEGVSETILGSKADLVVVLNLMTTGGEDHHLSKASKWLSIFRDYLGDREWITRTGRSRINYLVANEDHIDPQILKIYDNEGQRPVQVDEEECIRLAPGLKIVSASLATYDRVSHLLRHDPIPLARTVLFLPPRHGLVGT